MVGKLIKIPGASLKYLKANGFKAFLRRAAAEIFIKGDKNKPQRAAGNNNKTGSVPGPGNAAGRETGDAANSDVSFIFYKLKIEIARTAAAERAAGMPEEISAPVSKDEEFKNKKSYALDEFLGLDGEEFVRYAYFGILKRAPDPEGLALHLNLLRSGTSKTDMLKGIRHSREGNIVGANISGI